MQVERIQGPGWARVRSFRRLCTALVLFLCHHSLTLRAADRRVTAPPSARKNNTDAQ